MFWIKRHLYYQVKRGEVIATLIEEDKSLKKRCDALNHPRTLMGDFDVIENCFKSLVEALAPKRFLLPAHTAVVHLLEDMEGGYTNVERRAFLEAATGAGAKKVFVSKARTRLSKDQILNHDF